MLYISLEMYMYGMFIDFDAMHINQMYIDMYITHMYIMLIPQNVDDVVVSFIKCMFIDFDDMYM